MRRMKTIGVMAMLAALVAVAQGCGGMDDTAQAGAAAKAKAPDGVIVLDGSRAFLTGVVSAKSAAALSIAGLSIDITAAQLRDAGGADVTADAFLALVTEGVTRVKVRWDPYTSASAPVERAEIEAD